MSHEQAPVTPEPDPPESVTPEPGTPEPGQPSQPGRTASATRDRNHEAAELPEGGERPPEALASDGEPRPSPRPWSPRRIPAALAALVVLVGAGMLLVDVVSVRAGNEAAAWRKDLADELASRPVDDVWMLTGAAVAAALGLWLIVLALTPGSRNLLPLHILDSRGSMRAVLDRRGAAQLLRDAAMRVPGVSRARVRVRRRRVKVRADVRFRDLHEVQDELTSTLKHEQIDRLALARLPRLTVRVRRRTT
ncbi:DUF6286 domain-containing protein [Streptomyces sp. 7N604]|uniref:DUF6286 domain-containing protein n=1 Tax=Streptomyces sp. 7N604 TaxID=3457415 RepID=UPI003FD55091